ncbi:MAG: hypothetical protein GC190_14035 [Alphaproteobacteria bacterium]|nr:hypothetical protein [Alphaproteobacteria bacterium]
MSDIDIKFEWWELILLSPMLGWPGLLLGGIAGAFAWRKRPIVGGSIGAVAGNFVWALAAVYLM